MAVFVDPELEIRNEYYSVAIFRNFGRADRQCLLFKELYNGVGLCGVDDLSFELFSFVGRRLLEEPLSFLTRTADIYNSPYFKLNLTSAILISTSYLMTYNAYLIIETHRMVVLVFIMAIKAAVHTATAHVHMQRFFVPVATGAFYNLAI